MNPADWPGGLAYLTVFVAAILEGEVVFITASVLVGRGELNALGVLLAGALGGSAGDQFFFYVLRGRLHRWLDRFPRVARRHRAITARVARHSTAIILACRFLPGLRHEDDLRLGDLLLGAFPVGLLPMAEYTTCTPDDKAWWVRAHNTPGSFCGLGTPRAVRISILRRAMSLKASVPSCHPSQA